MRGKFVVVSPAFGSEMVEGPRALAVFLAHKAYCRAGETVVMYRQGERGVVKMVRQDTLYKEPQRPGLSQ